jgi:hypothetical protein
VTCSWVSSAGWFQVGPSRFDGAFYRGTRDAGSWSQQERVSVVREIGERNGASRRFLIDQTGGNTGG